MPGLIRFGVSLNKELLSLFDAHIRKKNYPTRSKAIEDLIRGAIVTQEWGEGSGDVAGVITMVYNHHRRELVNDLLDLQHDYQRLIISTQHVHLTHDNCLEVLAVKGAPKEIRTLADRLQSLKGVQHLSLNIAAVK